MDILMDDSDPKLWKEPIKTLKYASKEFAVCIRKGIFVLRQYRFSVLLVTVLLTLWCFLLQIDGPHNAYVERIQKQMRWYLSWIILGVMSSVGFGTGLHTFVLNLGPFIAAVTVAAYECNSLDFPEPPFPNEILCPEDNTSTSTVGIFQIMSKVRFPAIMWGIGTALGELPPYFIARASRTSGYEDDSLEEFHKLLAKNENPNLWDRIKIRIEEGVKKYGFIGILICASIPNPFFDLAGMTCGHFLVPFWTFFGATLLGKAIFKMHLQQLFVIVAFNDNLVQKAIHLVAKFPMGKFLQRPLVDYLQSQKAKFRGGSATAGGGGNILAYLLQAVVVVMVLYYVVSMIHGLAQSHNKKLTKKK